MNSGAPEGLAVSAPLMTYIDALCPNGDEEDKYVMTYIVILLSLYNGHSSNTANQ